MPRGMLEHRAAEQLPDRDACFVAHCGVGGRGSLVAKSLTEMGCTNVSNLEGGSNVWREGSYETG